MKRKKQKKEARAGDVRARRPLQVDREYEEADAV